MSIPSASKIEKPFLEILINKDEMSLSDIVKELATYFNLNENELEERYPHSGEKIFKNKVAWTRQNLIDKKKIISTKRGYVSLSKDINTYRVSEIFLDEQVDNPLDTIEKNYTNYFIKLRNELLSKVLERDFDFLEELILKLLTKMGYGNNIKNSTKRTGKTGDNGIDGIIYLDRLGLEAIYLQAKRWENPVGEKEIRDFVGSLEGKKAKKGVFITTSTFSRSAFEYCEKLSDKKVVLIDGQELAEYMIEFNLGTSEFTTYQLKKIDNDFFDNF